MTFEPFSYRLIAERPDRLTEVSSWHAHIPFAFVITELLAPNVFVELGTWKGDSYCAFCQAVEQLSLETSCSGIDSWAGDIHTGAYPTDAYAELKAYHDGRYRAFSRLLKTTFDAGLPQFQNGAVDLLHIDGCHTYEAVSHDFAAWLPKLSSRGVVLLHDTQVRDEPFGVWRLWNEISAAYPSFEFTHGHGLGVVAVGEDQKPALLDFLRQANDEPEQTRALFTALGSRVELMHEVDRLSLEADRAARKLADARAQIKARQHPPPTALQRLRTKLKRNRVGAAVRRLHPRISEHSQRTPVAGRPQSDDSSAAFRPLVSVVVPVFETPRTFLAKAIESVERQTYENWELCLSDDGSASPEVHTVLRAAAARDARIKIATSPVNEGISAASNRALQIATGEWVAFLDHDDELARGALHECVSQLASRRDLDVLYTDEDKIELDGSFSDAFYKPDWSPDFFRGVMYVGHLLVVRRALLDSIMGFDSRFDGVQDFELVLRLSERTTRIGHLPKTLYHWRKAPGSVAAEVDAKEYVPERQVAAVNAHLIRARVPAVAQTHPRLPHRVLLKPSDVRQWPLVTVVTPEATDSRLDRALARSTYPRFEVITFRDDTQATTRSLNAAAERANGDLIAFVSGSVEFVTRGWLEALVWPLEQEDVAVVAPVILDKDRSVLGAGVAVGIDGGFADMMGGLPRTSDGYAGSLSCMREASAVRRTCLVTSRELFDHVGGFRADYRTGFYDIDFCLRLRRLGERILVTPRALLIDADTTAAKADAFDRALALDVWQDVIEQGDPYYSVRFGRDAANYRVGGRVAA
jgi:glycosyltransferase involved in cell wall biosynthesis